MHEISEKTLPEVETTIPECTFKNKNAEYAGITSPSSPIFRIDSFCKKTTIVSQADGALCQAKIPSRVQSLILATYQIFPLWHWSDHTFFLHPVYRVSMARGTSQPQTFDPAGFRGFDKDFRQERSSPL